MLPATPAQATAKVPGIDVSTYQRRIDWRQVASTRIRFAIIRASLGNAYVDGHYRRNVAGASAHGLVVGAYHYAKPGRARWDATAEANHFLKVARIASGDVVPVLDIEDSGGLSRRQLWLWTKRWLTRVREVTGVRAMIYAGSYFWARSMGNTAWFGRHGYPHWVAHWYVRRPDVPGQGWGGRGWTFWQWSASGRVPGIRGPVDLDWFGSRDLSEGTIASIAVTPGPGGTIAGPMLECGARGTRCSRLLNPGSPITLRAEPSAGARFLRWTGACAAAGTAKTCQLAGRGGVRVSAVFERGGAPGAPAEPSVSGAVEHRADCGPLVPSCVISALLSGGLGSRLREVLPALLHGNGSGSGASTNG